MWKTCKSCGVAGLVWHWNFSQNSNSQIAKILKSLKTFPFLKKTHFLKSLQILKSLKTFHFLKKTHFLKSLQILKSLKTCHFLKKLIFSNHQIAQNISFFPKTHFLKSLTNSQIAQNLRNWRYFKGSSLSKLFIIELTKNTLFSLLQL